MIKPQDASLHPPESDDHTWAETNFFGFYVPEAHLNIGLYVLLRPNLGTALSTVCMNSRRTKVHWEAEYCDMQMHLPMGKDFDLLDYSLANGLSVRCTEPNMNWNLDYDDGEGTEVHVAYKSLMPPFDIHDPEQDPMVKGGFAWGTAYNGHFDQTGHFEGEVNLRGTKYLVDCVSTMDHSWGPRQERHAHEMSWLHAHFSKDFALHGIFSFDPSDRGTVLSLAHGYILENGKVYGLKAGTGKTTRNGWFPEEKVLEVTDSRDKTHTFRGEATTSFPWHAWPNVVGFNALMKWTDGEGRTGWGETQDFLGMGTLCELAGS
jgi:hypothetical protein